MWKLVLIAIVVRNADGKNENVNIKQDWWETAVFYQIYPRSFMDSDGDGIGDLNGITSRLEYLKELGVDATWLSPIFKSPMHDFGYDVSDYYSIQPEYGTMEDFDQLLKKAKELNIKIILDFVPNHTSNESDWFIKSVNKDEYYSDWYIWEGGHINDRGQRSPPNNWDGRQADGPLRISQLPSPIGVCNASGIANTLLSHKGTGTCVANAGTQNKIIIAAYIRPKISVFRKSAWTYIPNRDEYYLHQFGEAQPDLNYRNPVVFEEIKSIIKFWLEKGIAGMRINAVNYIMEVDKDSFGGHYPDEPITGKPGLGPDDYDYLHHVYTRDQEETYDVVSQFRDVFDAISIRDNITRIMMTDAYSGIKNAVRYYGEGIHSGAHIPFNFALMNDLNKDSDARDIKYAVDRWLTYKPLKKHANWVTGDHDKSRVASRLGPQMVDAFNMLVLLLPGIALTYMGEEIGMVNGFVPWSGTRDPLACNTDDPVNFIEVSRDPVRTPFQWNNGKNAGFSTAPHTWLPVADSFETVNVASQRSAVRSHYQVYRTLTSLRLRPAFKYGRYESLALNNDVFAFKRWYNEDTYVVVMNFGKTYHVVNLTAFDLIFGQLEVEASSVSSSRTYSDNVHANYLDLAADEALVLRMQV